MTTLPPTTGMTSNPPAPSVSDTCKCNHKPGDENVSYATGECYVCGKVVGTVKVQTSGAPSVSEMENELVSGPARSGYAHSPSEADNNLSGEIVKGLDGLYLAEKKYLTAQDATIRNSDDVIHELEQRLASMSEEQIVIMGEQTATYERYLEEAKEWYERCRKVENERDKLAIENLDLAGEVGRLRGALEDIRWYKTDAGTELGAGCSGCKRGQIAEQALTPPIPPTGQ